MFDRRRGLVGILLAAVLFAGITVSADLTPLRTLLSQGQLSGWDKLQGIIELVRDRYVDEVDVNTVIEGAISGAVRALGDPYSDYLGPSEWEDLVINARGNYSGVGLTIGVRDKYVTVISPIKGSPAAEAGIKTGDRILKVDGKDLYDISSDKAADMIRGEPGTQVILTIMPAAGGATRDYTLTRQNITLPTVYSRMLEGNIGYIQLTQFGEGCSVEVGKAVDEMKAAGAKAFVLDLRGNPGGVLQEAVRVSSLFVPEGPVVSIVDRNGKQETKVSESSGLGLPLVVLIDGGSASASEIVAGAVQDRKAGTLVGTKTFGKGSVQQLIGLKDGSGLKITTAKYLTPSGRSIQGVGIDPDVVVNPPEGDGIEPVKLARQLRTRVIGLDVLAVQERLNALGNRLTEDGIYGSATAQAVEAFQKAHSLKVTGEVDQAIMDAIDTAAREVGAAVDPQLESSVSILRSKMQ